MARTNLTQISKHPITALLLAFGAVIGIALTYVVGMFIDDHRRIGTSGVIAFLIATVAIFVGTELVAGVAGERLQLEWRRSHPPPKA